MLGHLQKNKVNRAVQIFDCVQSVDSVKLIEAIDRSAAQLGKVQGCLVEVKVSEEPSKSGLPPEGLEIFLGQCQTFKNIKLQGLMAMAPYFENADRSRPYFSKAKKLFDKFFGPPSSFSLQPPILSMGMSADFEVAIEEGSNMIRVGSAIFGSRTALASA